MAHRPIPTIQTKRYEAYENLISSFDTENDLNETSFDNLTNLEFDR
jgi:hypothetical protein